MNMIQYRVVYIRREPAGNISFDDIRFVVNVDADDRFLSPEEVAAEYQRLHNWATVIEVERITLQKLA